MLVLNLVPIILEISSSVLKLRWRETRRGSLPTVVANNINFFQS